MNVQQILDEVTDHARGMWRFRWITVSAAWAVAIAGWYYVYLMPDIYEADAKVSVDTNSLLPKLTQGLTASENLMSEVEVVSKALLTRPNLEAVARDTDLALRATSQQDLDLLVTGLQQRVKIHGGGDNVFSISYQDSNRDMARTVVASILNTFVETSLGAQGDDTEVTERALKAEIQNHEQRLSDAEAKLADFKARNLGFMPENGADYYTRLQTALAKVSDTERQLRQARQKRDVISRQLEGEEPVFGLVPNTSAQAMANCSQAANIAQLKSQLSELLVDFTEKHPRIVMLRDTIATLEKQCKEELASMPNVSVPDSATQSLDTNPVYQSLRLQQSNVEIEISSLQEQYSDAKQQVAKLRADVDKIAEVEKELKRLNRDYGVIASRHQELLKRLETLESKKRLDPLTDQIRFDIIEPPYVSSDPVGPHRPILLVAVLVFAIGAGGAIAFGLNQLKPVFFTRRSISRIAGLPVLGSVSLIVSPDAITVRRRMALVWGGAVVSLVVAEILIITFARPMSGMLRMILGGVGT